MNVGKKIAAEEWEETQVKIHDVFVDAVKASPEKMKFQIWVGCGEYLDNDP